MKPSQLFRAINGLLDCKLVPMIWGPPGIGKSDIVAQVAQHRAKRIKGYELRDIRLGTMDPTDIKGFPAPDLVKKVMHWLPPDFFPTKGSGLLFLDELSAAPPAVQVAAYQLLLNRCIGNYKLPDGWDIAGAGNGTADRAVAYQMSSALTSRMIHCDAEVDCDEFLAWADANGVSLEIAAFLKFRKNLIHAFNPDTRTRAFPCPRTWAFADRVYRGSGLHGDDLLQTLKGTVGEGAAGEFMAFLPVMRELPDLDEIKKNPKKYPVPKAPSVVYATITMLGRSTTLKDFPTFMDYVARMDREYQMAYVVDAIKRDEKIEVHPSYKNWALENIDLVSPG